MLSKTERYKLVQIDELPVQNPYVQFGEMPPSLPKPQFDKPKPIIKNDYKTYSIHPSPPGYHRYQSNTCNPTQDKLPITFPDPNEGVPPFEYDPLIMNLKYGSMPCGACSKLNYCQ
jgi:hypothetical protein